MPGTRKTLSNAVLGARLRRARRAQGLSLKAVEAATDGEIGAATLSSYERGDHAIPVVRMCILADLYEIGVQELITSTGERPGAALEVPAGGDNIRLDLDELAKPRGREAEMVAHLVKSVQVRRHEKSTGSIALRHQDLETAAATLGRPMESFVMSLSKAGVLRRARGRPRSS
jgi:transcriptional regulator with XRE-family HTH domain